jgi:HlyD family secretion protein
MKLTRKKMLYIGLPLVILIAVFTVLSMNGNSEEAVPVTTTNVDKQRVVETVTATGRIQPKTQVKISADVAAKITKLEVKEGDWVEKGRFLVQLDRERFLASVESAEANMRAAEANAHLVKENMIRAEKDYNRMKELFDKNLESQANMDQRYAAYQVEKARYQSALEQAAQAQAQLKQAKDDLSKTTIYAPMAGTISELNKEIGEIALGSQFQEDVIMVISNLSGMEALVDVDENDIVSIHIGDSASIEVDALPDMVFHGTVSEMANSAKISASGTTDQKTEFEVKIAIDDPGSSLRPGMTASSDIVTETRDDVLAVPIQCVSVRTPEQLKVNNTAESDSGMVNAYMPDKDGFVQIVFVVNDNKVEAVQVESGIQSDTHIEIQKGLSLGDEIVTGNYRAISQLLHNGTAVKVEEGGESLAVN